MVNNTLEKKLESLVRCLNRLAAKRPDTLEILRKDFDVQDIISVNLERAIQLAVDITAVIISEKGLKSSNTMAGGFLVLEEAGFLPEKLSKKLQAAVGFRNISVHNYSTIDWEIVFDVIHNHLESFSDFMKIVDAIS